MPKTIHDVTPATSQILQKETTKNGNLLKHLRYMKI